VKEFGGKTYEVAKANVSTNTGSDAGERTVVGIVHDGVAHMNYSVPLGEFNKFLEIGDMSTFGKPVDLTVK
jgi:hypothetical protein